MKRLRIGLVGAAIVFGLIGSLLGGLISPNTVSADLANLSYSWVDYNTIVVKNTPGLGQMKGDAQLVHRENSVGLPGLGDAFTGNLQVQNNNCQIPVVLQNQPGSSTGTINARDNTGGIGGDPICPDPFLDLFRNKQVNLGGARPAAPDPNEETFEQRWVGIRIFSSVLPAESPESITISVKDKDGHRAGSGATKQLLGAEGAQSASYETSFYLAAGDYTVCATGGVLDCAVFQPGKYDYPVCVPVVNSNEKGDCLNFKKTKGVRLGPLNFGEPFQEVGDGGEDATKEDLRIGCDYFENGLSWLICPFIRGGMSLLEGFDGIINKYLDVDVKPIFDDSTETGAAYHKAWSVMRTFALAIIAIAALVMIIAQAAGIDALDAYTIRKILPRLLLATIGITLSWEVMEFMVTVSNDFGHAIRAIIYTPFEGVVDVKQLDLGTNFVLLIITGVAIAAYGIIALLTLVVTAVLASFLAVAVLVGRELIMTALAVTAPFFIACAIMNGTRKVWSFGWTTWWAALLLFAAWSALIATGRVFSAISAANGGTIAQIVAVGIWFGVYLLMLPLINVMGGGLATVANFASDRTKGVFNGLKNFRGGEVKGRGKRWRTGELWNPDSKWTKRLGGAAVNRVGAHVGATRGTGGHWMGFGKVGAAKRANNMYTLSDEYAREDKDFASHIENEAAMAALIFNYDREALGGHIDDTTGKIVGGLEWFHDRDTGTIKWDAVDAAISQAKTIRRSGRSVSAAVDALGKSGKVIQNRDEMDDMLDIASGGNQQFRGALKGRYQWLSRGAGNAVVGRDTDFAALEEMSLQQWGSLKPWAAKDLLPSIAEMVASGETVPASLARNPSERASSRALTTQEQDHFVDLLFSGQYGPYSNLYQQQGIQDAITKIRGTAAGAAAWSKAEDHYRSKLGGAGGPPGTASATPTAAPVGAGMAAAAGARAAAAGTAGGGTTATGGTAGTTGGPTGAGGPTPPTGTPSAGPTGP